MRLPRNAQIWLPGYLRSVLRSSVHHRTPPHTVWVAIADHYEPYWKTQEDALAVQRVELWSRQWPALAARHSDSYGRPPVYSLFYAEEEYRPHLVEPLERLVRAGIGDVEVHIHHDREGEQNFVDRIGRFVEVLDGRHGLLRRDAGRPVFAFVHGNWALDNSLPGGLCCGLNNEISLLCRLGCYADFTLPSAPSPAQTSTVNSIYWATDDPARPKSHDRGIPVAVGAGRAGELMMIQGPLAVRWEQGRFHPQLDTGELAAQDRPTLGRVRLWLRYAPRIGGHAFIKLFTHGAQERNARMLLEGGLDSLFEHLKLETGRLGTRLRYVSTWDMYRAIEALRLCQPCPI